MTTYDFADKTVVITGASTGIGAVFSRELGRRGSKLVLVARSRDKLAAVAREVGGAVVVVEDLATPGAARRVRDAVTAAGLEADVLVNNAGFAAFGPFTDVALTTQREEIDLNVAALVELTHTFLPMLERRRGGVIHVASTAAFQPVPFMAVYGATKAFVLSFSEALWAEYRTRGVRVVALCPGATDTPFFDRAGAAAAFGPKARREDVVRLGLEAFQANRASVVHGAGNRVTTRLSRFATREFTAKLTARLMRPRAATATAHLSTS